MVRGFDLFFSLFNNLALFIALMALYGLLLQKIVGSVRIKRQSLVGLLFGIFAIGCMHARIPVYEGVIVDQRNAVVALSGAFGGPVSALVSAVLAGGFRLYLGGGGVLSGVVGVCLAAVSGILLHRFPGRFKSFGNAALSSFVAVLVILPGFLLVGDLKTGWELTKAMAIPYGLAIFSGIFLAGLLLNRAEERLLFEESSRKSEKLYRELIEGTQDLITQTDIQGNLTFVNHVSREFLGHPPSECVGMSSLDFVHPEDVGEVVDLYRKIRASGEKSLRVENRLINAESGKILDVLWVCDFLYDSSGTFLGTVNIGRDVTEHKRAEEERDRLRRYLTDIIDSTPSVIIGVEKGFRVTLWNRTAREITGLSSEEAEGRIVGEVFPRLADREETVERAMRTGEVQRLSRTRFEFSDGSFGYEDVTVYPLTSGSVEGVVVRLDNVTDLVRMEENLIQNEKMLSLGGLAAGMAHEINNPLAGIVQNADVLVERLSDVSMPANTEAAETAGTTMEAVVRFLELRRVPRMLESIRSSGLRVTAIVEDMLNFARKSDMSFLPHDPVGLMDKALALAAADSRSKKGFDFGDIEIRKEYEENLPPVVCEGNNIRQVLLNLLINGTYAMAGDPSGGKARFVLKLAAETESGMLRMEIGDNGPGMSDEIRNKIFEPFFTTKPVGEGTGLGLSISYFIITEYHRGAIEVETEPGKGANFIIRLPFEPQ